MLTAYSELALKKDEPFDLFYTSRGRWKLQRPDDDPTDYFALSKTCRAISLECTQLVYAVNTFDLQTNYSVEPWLQIEQFRRAIGPLNHAALQDAVVYIGSLEKSWGHEEDSDEDEECLYTSAGHLFGILKDMHTLPNAKAYSLRWELCSQRVGSWFAAKVETSCSLSLDNVVEGWTDVIRHVDGMQVDGLRSLSRALKRRLPDVVALEKGTT